MERLIAASLTAAMALGGSAVWAETTLNALFMSQAAYSEADVRAMADGYMKEHPDTKINLEFVPYEGLRDKTLLAQGSGQGYDVVLFDESFAFQDSRARWLYTGITRAAKRLSVVV